MYNDPSSANQVHRLQNLVPNRAPQLVLQVTPSALRLISSEAMQQIRTPRPQMAWWPASVRA
jgi:hypothetical protein